MADPKVFFLPLDRWKEVPTYIEKAAGNFISPHQFVALKIHFGEKGNKGYINPVWAEPIARMIKKVKAHPFFTDTNTIYRGHRDNAASHLMIAAGHGFKMEKCGAPIIIADGLRGEDYVEVDIDGSHFKKVKIARSIYEAQAMVALSHVKGHLLTGFGGAIKNLGMGCAAKGGKYEMHNDLVPKVNAQNCTGCGECIPWCCGDALSLTGTKIVLDETRCVGCGQCILTCTNDAINIPWDLSGNIVQEKVVEYAAGSVKGKSVCYVNYVNHITKDCDCFPTNEPPLIDDIGILVSSDPVAIDQAGVDLINKQTGKDFFKSIHEAVDYNVQLAYAEKMGMGSREYQLVS